MFRPPGGIRKRTWVFGFLALALLVILPLTIVNAVHSEFLFELGNTEGDPGSADILGDSNIDVPDWADIFDSDGSVITPAYSAYTAEFIRDGMSVKGFTEETAFATSNKNNDPISVWGWGSVKAPVKDDLSNVYFYTTLTGTGDLILYAGLERLDPGGASHIDIEINQDLITLVNPPSDEPPCTDEPCAFSGQKTEDDILIVMDFTKGGALGFFEVRYWDGNEWVLT
ncbi:MAG: hypothetical protein KAT29_02165, partial [Anaerolineales bacterium]|nr:hypothetical protein [Anaerolineales bacterium]